ncbi:hypothetical protein VNO80_02657 [Phaseolus coccineus]|uniref:Uncharacterized protein n=1 Tax=Phaseolus coccineus TaxID=3886 RepID=A0AAN9NQ29_PHACN
MGGLLEKRLASELSKMTLEEALTLARAFSHHLTLMGIAETQHSEETLFLLAVMVSERCQDVRVSKSPKASKIQRQPTSHGDFVCQTQSTVSKNLRRNLHQIGQAKCASLIVNHHKVTNTP